MRYKGSVYRPPSEAYSLIVQVTYGCSHNTCAFCSMYKEKHFAIRPLEEVLEDFRIARGVYRRVDRVFLADGDALVRKANELYTILDTIRELFPECERVTSYASPASIRIRTEEELRTLRDKGLTMVYMGLESGCDDVLKRMRKGHMSAEIVEMGRKVRRCGMALSVTAITGLGGPELLERHAIETAEAFNAMNPEYIGDADADGGAGDAPLRLGAGRQLPTADPAPGAGGNPAADGASGQPRQRVPEHIIITGDFFPLFRGLRASKQDPVASLFDETHHGRFSRDQRLPIPRRDKFRPHSLSKQRRHVLHGHTPSVSCPCREECLPASIPIFQNEHVLQGDPPFPKCRPHRRNQRLRHIRRLLHLPGELPQDPRHLLKLQHDRVPALQKPVLPGEIHRGPPKTSI